MTGKEIVDICVKHDLCDECELRASYQALCRAIEEEMENGVPSTIQHILESEYGGGK